MTSLQDCLGRIYRPLEGCVTCVKDEHNLRCPCYQPHQPIELVDVGDIEPRDEYGDKGAVEVPRRLDDRIG